MSNIEELAYKIKELLEKHEVYEDVRIYFEGKCLCSNSGLLENMKASDYSEFANDKTIFMTFEGRFNYIINGYVENKTLVSKFDKIINKYGYYHEFGEAWNLSLYE